MSEVAAVFPFATLRPVYEAGDMWCAVLVDARGCGADGLAALLGEADLPLEGVLRASSPSDLGDDLLGELARRRIAVALPAAQLSADGVGRLASAGLRLMVDGLPDAALALPHGLLCNAADGFPTAPVQALEGPHLAVDVNTLEQRKLAEVAGFEWFCGRYPLLANANDKGDGTSAKRLLGLLALLAADADTRELEALLKQDPALSFNLLKLVNSAAYTHKATITTYHQAINMLGRRQLQRWLQLLLYARQDHDAPPNPLLPLAAWRGAQMEALWLAQGGDEELHDEVFMTGVFSLLDALLGMPMADIVGALKLPQEVADALLSRSGPFGALLSLCDAQAPDRAGMEAAGVTAEAWWQSELKACQWAIQVSKDL